MPVVALAGVDFVGGGGVVAYDGGGDVGEGCDVGLDGAVCGGFDVLDGDGVEGVGHGQGEGLGC